MLPLTMFNRSGKRNNLRADCKSCNAKLHRTWFANGGKQKRKQYRQANPVLTITARLVSSARNRAKSKNIPFDIDVDYVRSMVGNDARFASHCPVFGSPLDWSTERGLGCGALPNSPSLDRIDPQRGYVKGNIWVISHRANTIKNDASHEELKLVTKAVGEAIVNSLEF